MPGQPWHGCALPICWSSSEPGLLRRVAELGACRRHTSICLCCSAVHERSSTLSKFGITHKHPLHLSRMQLLQRHKAFCDKLYRHQPVSSCQRVPVRRSRNQYTCHASGPTDVFVLDFDGVLVDSEPEASTMCYIK